MFLSSLGDWATCRAGLCSQGGSVEILSNGVTNLNNHQVQMPANDWEWYCLNQVHSR